MPGALESRGSLGVHQKHRLTHLDFPAREPQCRRHAVPFAQAAQVESNDAIDRLVDRLYGKRLNP